MMSCNSRPSRVLEQLAVDMCADRTCLDEYGLNVSMISKHKVVQQGKHLNQLGVKASKVDHISYG